MSTRSRIASITSVVAALVLLGGTATAAAPQAAGPQRDIDAYLGAHPGGVQVSDNAVAYRDGEVVIVFPDPGERRAPEGLGRNVRSTALATEVSTSWATSSASAACNPFRRASRRMTGRSISTNSCHAA